MLEYKTAALKPTDQNTMDRKQHTTLQSLIQYDQKSYTDTPLLIASVCQHCNTVQLLQLAYTALLQSGPKQVRFCHDNINIKY